MKIIFTLMSFILINLFANENWIKIEPINNTQMPRVEKVETKLDVNLSQIEPINKMMKNVTLLQKIIKTSSKKETKKQTTDDKNWFVIKGGNK